MALRRMTKDSNRPSFKYTPRTADQMTKRAQQSGSNREGYFSQEINFFAPRVGDNRIRILPPTWNNPEHYGLEIFVHYGIGADNNAYLCLDKTKNEVGVCPVCKERARAEASGDKEYADTLRYAKRVAVYLIDRDKSGDGVLLWAMPWSIDRDICAQAVDRDSGEVFAPDNPEDGYDVLFRREGQSMTTKYTGVSVARKPQPLSDKGAEMAEWLQYAIDNPILDKLVYYEPEHIEKVLRGGAVADEVETPAAAGKKSVTETPVKAADGEELSYDIVMGMGEEAILEVCDKYEITEDDLGDAKDADLTVFKAKVCEVLKLEPAPAAAKLAAENKTESVKSRLARLRNRST